MSIFFKIIIPTYLVSYSSWLPNFLIQSAENHTYVNQALHTYIHISEEHVLLAPSLAKSGEQRLYDIINGEPQVFFFTILLGDRRAALVKLYG